MTRRFYLVPVMAAAASLASCEQPSSPKQSNEPAGQLVLTKPSTSARSTAFYYLSQGDAVTPDSVFVQVVARVGDKEFRTMVLSADRTTIHDISWNGDGELVIVACIGRIFAHTNFWTYQDANSQAQEGHVKISNDCDGVQD
jgi:hypothetical protein